MLMNKEIISLLTTLTNDVYVLYFNRLQKNIIYTYFLLRIKRNKMDDISYYYD